MPINPYREADDEHHYSRIFPPGPRPGLEDVDPDTYATAIKRLVDCMRDEGQQVCEHLPEHSLEIPINAGYTYFGQFLDHELTDDTSDVGGAWNAEPHTIKNRRSSRLDLDHLYGSQVGAPANPVVLEADGVRLKIGPLVDSVIGTAGPTRRSFDLRVEAGQLAVADKRAGDNVILRQITAVFARLHNRAVKQWDGSLQGRPLFEKARFQTTRQFQLLVWEDYLPQVLDPDVYKTVFIHRAPQATWNRFTVPAEFSAAAMRFGHSMVRDSYFLNNVGEDVPLHELVSLGKQTENLAPEFEIDWGALFENASGSTTISARPIDTRIIPDLHGIDMKALLLYNEGQPFTKRAGPINLPVVSLTRGAGLRLATGQNVATSFGFQAFTDELTRDCGGNVPDQGRILRELGLVSETPLFFYILKEAEIVHGGNKLGPTGSQLIADTVFAALEADTDSYLYHRDPPFWDFGADALEPIESLSELFSRAPEL